MTVRWEEGWWTGRKGEGIKKYKLAVIRTVIEM